MHKKITITALTVLLLFSFSLSYCQKLKPDYYYIVTLKGEKVSNMLNNSQFAYFDFTYKELADGKYTLSCFAMDDNNQPIGNEIELIAMTDQPARPLKNKDRKGQLRLDKETMQANDVDGTEDYILTPKKCKDHSGQLVDYVSYRFNNMIDDSDDNGSTGSLTAVKAFNLNPSPPY